jgi:hypothetical protein
MPNKSTSHESAKAYLKASLEQVIAAGHSVSEFKDYVVDKFGDAVIPQLRHFLTEVRLGKVEIKGLSQSAKEAVLGHPYSDEEREAMIKEAAYFIAEKHGFDGNDKRDWALATQQIDDQIAAETGLVSKSKKAFESSAAIIEEEYNDLKTVVTDWLQTRFGTEKKKKPRKIPVMEEASKPKAKTAPKKKAVAKKKTAPKKKAATKSDSPD